MLDRLTIRTKLFLTDAILVTFVVSLACLLYYSFSKDELNRSAYDSLNQSTVSLSTQLEMKIRDLDSVTTKVIMSSDIKDAFFAGARSDAISGRLNDFRNVSDNVYSIMGPMSLGWQINLIDSSGWFISVGRYSYDMRYPQEAFRDMRWLEDVYQADGSRVITPPHSDYWNNNARSVISVARAFGASFTAPKTAIVEVQQDYDELCHFIGGFLGNADVGYSDSVRVYVVDRDGRTLYPAGYPDGEGGESEGNHLWKKMADNSGKLPSSSIQNTFNGKRDYDAVAAHTSEYTGWTTMLVLPESILLSHTRAFWRLAILLLIGILLVTLAISYFASKSLTNPIRSMFRSIQAISPSELSSASLSGGSELVNLERIFREMSIKLRESMEQAISIREKEVEARMVALQAQMNPHMLYNMISTIHILAEESGNTQIMEICRCMNHMFQYILGSSRTRITIRDELNYIEDYLALQKVRFGDFLDCSVDLDPQLMEIEIPKLIIQPLLENCIKHGASSEPTWRISVSGTIENGVWTIRVEDNGSGFAPEFISNWRRIRSSSQAGYGRSTDSDHGVGLKNTYERLLLFYGEDMIFKLFNRTEGGACVLFGAIDRRQRAEPADKPETADESASSPCPPSQREGFDLPEL